MDPLSARTRKRYFILFIAFFIVVIPLAILYASGYRIGDGLSLISTGGMYVSVPENGADVSLNGRNLGQTGLFTRSFYEDDLSPGTYVLAVSLEGYYPWYKTIVVEEHLVTDASAFLVPQQLETVELLRGATTTSTTTRSLSRTQYDSYLAAFQPATTTATTTNARVTGLRQGSATTSEASALEIGPLPDDVQGGKELYVEDGNVRLHWARASSTIPSIFCLTPSSCVGDFPLEKGKERTVTARFYAGGVVYSTKEAGIFLVEADIRPTPLLVPLYQRRGADFRIIDGELIIKDGQKLYQIVGL